MNSGSVALKPVVLHHEVEESLGTRAETYAGSKFMDVSECRIDGELIPTHSTDTVRDEKELSVGAHTSTPINRMASMSLAVFDEDVATTIKLSKSSRVTTVDPPVVSLKRKRCCTLTVGEN